MKSRPDIFDRCGLSQERPVLMLAPMEGITSYLFREALCGFGAPDFVVTEFIRVSAGNQSIQPPRRHTAARLQIQFMASDEEAIAQVIERMNLRGELFESDWIDLNVGCPSRRVNSHGAGAALLLDPARLRAIVASIRSVHTGPLSIKTRLGFHSEEELPHLVELFHSLPIDFLTLHARTRCGGYSEPVRRDLLAHVNSALHIPVIANGDINSAEEAREVIAMCRTRGVMCGRGAIRNPLVFREIRGERFSEVEKLTLLWDFALDFIQLLVEDLGPRRALGPIKEYVGFFSQNPLIGRGAFEAVKRLGDVDNVYQALRLLRDSAALARDKCIGDRSEVR